MEEKVIKMSLLVDKNTKEPVQVFRDDNVECYFSLLFPGLTFEGTIKDEFHLFPVLFKDGEPIAICYSETAAVELMKFLNKLNETEFETVEMKLLRYREPKLLGEDEESFQLRVRKYMQEFCEEKGIQEEFLVTADENWQKEFMMYIYEHEMLTKAYIDNHSAEFIS